MANNNLTTKPIPELIKQIAIPSSVGFLFNTLYNVIDTFYSGLVSTEAVAALSLSFPIFFLIIALGSGISTGTTALIANSLGAKKEYEAKQYSVQAISFSLIISFFLTAIGLILSPYLFRLLGASEEYLSLSLSYSNVIFYGAFFFMLIFILNSILTAEGDTKTYRNVLIVSFFLNLIFDPWFIYGGLGLPALGLAGVAWATVAIQVMGSFYLFYKVVKKNILCRECLSMIRPRLKYYREITKQGFPASLNMMTVALGIFVITYFISKYGHEAVAAYGIATRVDQMALLPMIGLNIATLTLVGQNNGAKLPERVKETIKIALKYGTYMTIAGMILIFFGASWLMGVFTHDPVVIETGVNYLRISVLVYWAYTFLFMATSALQGLKKPFYAIWIGSYRQIIAPLFFFWLLSILFGWGLDGIWWGVFTVNWSAAIFTWFYLQKQIKKL